MLVSYGEIRIWCIYRSKQRKWNRFCCFNLWDAIFIQVSLSLRDSNTYEKEIAPLKALNNSYSKIILTMDEAPVKDDNGIKIIYVLDWLLNWSINR